MDLSTTTVFDITGAPVQIPRNFPGLELGAVIWHVVQPELDRAWLESVSCFKSMLQATAIGYGTQYMM